MLRRIRTTKKLAKRMDLQYFTPPASVSELAAVAVDAGSGGGGGLVRVAASHRAEGLQQRTAFRVARCVRQTLRSLPRDHAGIFPCKSQRYRVSELSRRARAPVDKVAFTPACGSCHLEHKGSLKLASTADSSCTQCHADLRTRTGKSNT